MILTKQLGALGDTTVSATTPRYHLAKELEKYNRPELQGAAHTAANGRTTLSNTPTSTSNSSDTASNSFSPLLIPKQQLQKTPPVRVEKDRPNILRRPSFKPRSTTPSPRATPPLTASTAGNMPSPAELAKGVRSSFTRSVTALTIPNPLMSKPTVRKIPGVVINTQKMPTVTPISSPSIIEHNTRALSLPKGYVIIKKIRKPTPSTS